MDELPEDIQYKIYKNVHELNYNKTLDLIKRIKVEDNEYHIVELTMNNDFELIERQISNSDSSSDVDTIDTDTLGYIAEDIEELMNPRASDSLEQMEYYFVDAHNLTLEMSIHEQMQVVTNTQNIMIDLSCDIDYFFDEHFFDISMRSYGDDVWLKIQNKLNITISKFGLSRSPVCRQHNRYNKLWLTYHDPLPIRVCDIIHLIEEMNIKALYNHTYISSIEAHGYWTNQHGISHACIAIHCDS